jgi:hypothetical protein
MENGLLKKHCRCRTLCYISGMPSAPMPIRIEKELADLLSEGARRTPHKKQELIRLTLRRHLRSVIAEEATKKPEKRLTAIGPWPKGALTAAYKRVAHENWDAVEDAAAKAQGKPGLED